MHLSLHKREAAISFNTEFFAPLIVTSPDVGLDPFMISFSLKIYPFLTDFIINFNYFKVNWQKIKFL